MSIKNGITRALGKANFWTRQKGPELLVAASILSAGAAVYFAIKSTMKLEAVVTPHSKNITLIKEDMNNDNKLANNEYSIEQGKKDLTKEYFRLGLDITKLYLPTIITLGITTMGVLGSHKILKGRNIALAAAYKTLDEGFKQYRNRVAERYGELAENDIRRNRTTEVVPITTLDKNGKEVTKNEKVEVSNLDSDSDFTYIFDASHPDWEKNTRLNVDFLLSKEKYLNQRLQAQGYLFLFDVYDALGIYPQYVGERKLQASKVLGWIYDPNSDEGDSYISFGLADAWGNLNKVTMEAIRNNDRDFLLTFNPDGDILTGKNGNRTFMKYAKGM